MFKFTYFRDTRYRQERILWVLGLPFTLLAVAAGIMIAVHLPQNPSDRERAAGQPGTEKRDARLPSATPAAAAPTAFPVVPDSPRDLIEEAILAHEAGDTVGARKLLNKVDLAQAGSAAGWELAGLLKEAEGDRNSAMDLFSQGIVASPSEGLYFRRALLYRESGELECALADIDRAVAHAPADIVLTNERLLLLIQMGHEEQAREELNALNARGGKADASGWIFALCGMALESGEYPQARNLLILGKNATPPQIFEQMLKNPVLSRHQSRPEMMPFYITNLTTKSEQSPRQESNFPPAIDAMSPAREETTPPAR